MDTPSISRWNALWHLSPSCTEGDRFKRVERFAGPLHWLNFLFNPARDRQPEAVLGRLIDMLYERNDINFSRGPIDFANHVCGRKSFSRTGHAEQGLVAIACFDGLDPFGDRLSLVAAWFVVQFELERHPSK
jgi:hypothetical protein